MKLSKQNCFFSQKIRLSYNYEYKTYPRACEGLKSLGFHHYHQWIIDLGRVYNLDRVRSC